MDKIKQVQLDLVNKGMEMLTASVIVGTWGNISCQIPGEDYIAITTSGMKQSKRYP